LGSAHRATGTWRLVSHSRSWVADFVGVYLYDSIFGPFDEGSLAEFWDGSRAAQFAANFLVIAVLAPIFEELMFRGLGYGLLEPFGAGTAIVVTGVLFGLVHGYAYVLPVFITYGLALGWLRSRTGSIYPGVLAHSATNATALVQSRSPSRPRPQAPPFEG
jgi:membrane protease YdiL (CAAX protease family)